MRMLTYGVLLHVLGLLSPGADVSTVSKQPFGKTANHEAVYLYTVKNKHGMEVSITNFGGTIVSITVPDRSGHMADVVLGFDKVEGYESKANPYFGATVGRYANRIAKGSFKLNGQEYKLALNNPPNSLHGGKIGFDKKVWEVREADGHHLGHVDGFIVDDEQITHLVLERGHLWGKRDVAIPIRAVTKVETDAVTVSLSKDEIGALAEVPVHRWSG